METEHFDRLVRRLTHAHSRRGALFVLLGGAMGLLGLPEAEAKGHKKKHHKKKGGGSPPASPPGSPPCVPEPPDVTCAAGCGSRTNHCDQPVSCVCPPSQVCCDQQCVAGNCCSDAGCTDPTAPQCTDHTCVCIPVSDRTSGPPTCDTNHPEACCTGRCQRVSTSPAQCCYPNGSEVSSFSDAGLCCSRTVTTVNGRVICASIIG